MAGAAGAAQELGAGAQQVGAGGAQQSLQRERQHPPLATVAPVRLAIVNPASVNRRIMIESPRCAARPVTATERSRDLPVRRPVSARAERWRDDVPLNPKVYTEFTWVCVSSQAAISRPDAGGLSRSACVACVFQCRRRRRGPGSHLFNVLRFGRKALLQNALR